MTAAVEEAVDVGSLAVLNVGAGDVEVRFDTQAELDRAADLVHQMLRKGFAVLLKQPNGKYTRVKAVDKVKRTYAVGRRRGGGYRDVPMRGTRAVAVGRSAGG